MDNKLVSKIQEDLSKFSLQKEWQKGKTEDQLLTTHQEDKCPYCGSNTLYMELIGDPGDSDVEEYHIECETCKAVGRSKYKVKRVVTRVFLGTEIEEPGKKF